MKRPFKITPRLIVSVLICVGSVLYFAADSNACGPEPAHAAQAPPPPAPYTASLETPCDPGSPATLVVSARENPKRYQLTLRYERREKGAGHRWKRFFTPGHRELIEFSGVDDASGVRMTIWESASVMARYSQRFHLRLVGTITRFNVDGSHDPPQRLVARLT